MEKLLITGSKGFFCSRFIKQFYNKFDIYGFDKDDAEITDEKAIIKLVSQIRPNIIVHAAAVPITKFCNENPQMAHNINVVGALNVAKAASHVNAKLVFLSTEQVFGGNSEPGPYKETDIPIPNTEYGQNKVHAERLLQGIIEKLWILRFTWLFGLPERGCKMNPNILWNAIQISMKGIPTKITDNEFRGYTYVYDVIDQFDKVFQIPYGTYHVGCRNNLSRFDVTSLIFEELGLKSKINDLLIRTPSVNRDLRLDTTYIQSLGFEFNDSIESIKRCLYEFSYY